MSGPPEHQALTSAGLDAMRRGDFASAREHFRRATTVGVPRVDAWLGLALANRRLGDAVGALHAVDRALALEPYHFRALLVKGSLSAETGERKTAVAFYTAALRRPPPASQLESDAREELRVARLFCENYSRQYENHLQATLTARGFVPERSSKRFSLSLDLMQGRKKLYPQQPSQYYFPELPHIQFYDRGLFPWLDAIEAETDDIVRELREILNVDSEFKPYVERWPGRPRPINDSMTNNRNWTAFYLWRNGEIVEANAARCPKTMRVLENIPHCRIPKRTPSVLFSQLRPHTRIPPHSGLVNARLICHLPLIVPGKCGFRVGNDVRFWQKGEAWVFDDTIEHEAWNDSDETRVIMIFEIWRPELSGEERELVAALLEATATFADDGTTWAG